MGSACSAETSRHKATGREPIAERKSSFSRSAKNHSAAETATQTNTASEREAISSDLTAQNLSTAACSARAEPTLTLSNAASSKSASRESVVPTARLAVPELVVNRDSMASSSGGVDSLIYDANRERQKLEAVDETPEFGQGQARALVPLPLCPLVTDDQERLQALMRRVVRVFGSLGRWQTAAFDYVRSHAQTSMAQLRCPLSFGVIFDETVQLSSRIESAFGRLHELGGKHGRHGINGHSDATYYETLGELLLQHISLTCAEHQLAFEPLDAAIWLRHYRNVTTYMRLGSQDAMAKAPLQASQNRPQPRTALVTP